MSSINIKIIHKNQRLNITKLSLNIDMLDIHTVVDNKKKVINNVMEN